MLLTALRLYEDSVLTPSPKGKVGMGLGEVFCSDQDFFIAQQLTKIYIEYSICIFEKLPKSEGGLVIRNRANIKNVFFATLPNVFGYQAAAELAEKFEITTRTVRNYLHIFTEANFLVKEDHGLYRKVGNLITFSRLKRKWKVERKNISSTFFFFSHYYFYNKKRNFE